MAQIFREDRQVVEEPATRHVVINEADEPASWAQQLVYLLLSILQGLLAIRIILSLLGANTTNAFANFIYVVTNPFVAPFRGLFGYNLQIGVSRFEVETLVAMVVYGLIGYAIARLIGMGARRAHSY